MLFVVCWRDNAAVGGDRSCLFLWVNPISWGTLKVGVFGPPFRSAAPPNPALRPRQPSKGSRARAEWSTRPMNAPVNFSLENSGNL